MTCETARPPNPRFRWRHASSAQDLVRTLSLRSLAFRGRARDDADAYDAKCDHVLVEDLLTGRVVAAFRILVVTGADDLETCYAANHYGLRNIARHPGPMIEVGRFCSAPDVRSPDVMRIAWAALTHIVDAYGIRFLFGCSSFPGTEPDTYRDAFAYLRHRHLAPEAWRPEVGSSDVVRFDQKTTTDLQRAASTLPPLLRSYLAMGAWVGDHAVIDRDLKTLHVFTGLEIAKIPPARVSRLRASAGRFG